MVEEEVAGLGPHPGGPGRPWYSVSCTASVSASRGIPLRDIRSSVPCEMRFAAASSQAVRSPSASSQ